MSRLASFVAVSVMLLLAARPGAGSGGDHDPDQDSGPPPAAKRAATGKPVRFDKAWLTPFFEQGAAKQAAEQFRGEDWEDAERGFARAVKSSPRESGERLAARYMLALARANQGEWADAGQAFEELFKSYPKL